MDGTLYCFPSSAQITSMALAMCGGAPPGLSIVKGNPEELPRLELRNGGPVILGDRAIARFVSRVGGSTVKESPAASAALEAGPASFGSTSAGFGEGSPSGCEGDHHFVKEAAGTGIGRGSSGQGGEKRISMDCLIAMGKTNP